MARQGWIVRIDRRVTMIACLIAAGAVPGARAEAPEITWRNHIDASMINEIVPRGDILYMATFGGLVLYDVNRGTFDQYDTVSGLPSNSLTCLVFDADDNIYIGTDDIGIVKVRFSPGRISLVRALNEQIDGLASNTVNSVATWGEDIVYGSTPGAGTIRKDFASARYFKRDGLPASDVTDVLPDGDFVWMATDSGLAILDRFGLLRSPSGGPPQSNVLGTDGSNIWVGTRDGVWRLDPADSSWTSIGPASYAIHSLTWDGMTMWGGSTRSNLFRFEGTGSPWTLFQATPILTSYRLSRPNDNRLRSVAVMPGGDVYAGTAQPGERRGLNLLHYQGTNVSNPIPNTPGSNQIWRISPDVDDSVWCTSAEFFVGKLTPAGVWVNYNSTIPGIELPSSQYGNTTLLADSDGIKWFCTLSTPAAPVPLDALDDKLDSNYANDVWQRFGIGSGGGDGLQSLRLQRAREDPAGNIWFLCDEFQDAPSSWWGMQILSKDRGQWLSVTPATEPRLINGDVKDVAFWSNFAYVATKTDGVQAWKHDGYAWSTLTDFTTDAWGHPVTEDSLSSGAEISSLALRSDGILWIGTSDGLYRYEPGPRRVRKIPQYIGLAPGIINPVVNDVILDHQENLWVATQGGLNRIARDDYNDIQTYTTAAGYLPVAGLRYPLSIIVPLANANCISLAMHRTRDILYVGTFSGLSILDFAKRTSVATDLSKVYVYPNPVYGSRGENELKIDNIGAPVTIEIYNLEGELVHSTTATADGDVIWDLTNRNGFLVGSGNYLVRISGPDGAVTKPVAVLR